MVDEVETQPAAQTILTDAEIRALAYFAIGIGSEGSIGGRDVSNRLAFAGTVRNGVMDPVGNSGYSIGTLQTDLGQHPEAAAQLVDAYQAWARTYHIDWLLTDAQRTQTANDLGRNGQAIEAQNGRPLDATVKSHLDTFLASDAGITFVHERDVAQIAALVRPGGGMDQLQGTLLYQNSSLDDQAKLATMVLKLENQAGQGYYPRMINGIRSGTINSTEDAKNVVDGFMPNRSGPSRDGPDYVESGMDHALEGTEVFNALRNADPRSPLHQPWQSVLANPLVNPTQTAQDAAHPNLGSEYVAIKVLFLQKQSAPAFVEAMAQGGAYGYNVINGRGQSRPQSTSLYASGDDFVLMDGTGAGKAYVGCVWSDVERTELTRINNRDGTIDLDINRGGATERLLHIDPNAPVLRPRIGLLPTGVLDERPGQGAESITFTPVVNEEHHRNGADLECPPYITRHGAMGRNYSMPQSADDRLLPQAERAVRQLDQDLGRECNYQSACMAASVACLAKANGLSRIDYVLLSDARGTARQGDSLFVVQGDPSDPAHKRAQMKTEDAIGTPIERSMAQLHGLNEAHQKLQPAQAMEEPIRETSQHMRMS
ncbi:MAG: hypothetical protein EON59_04455 [Alphaproteobacteria bacterium]|nr:MAG: hypothetical protein EON59_04455 [Alphaproteobacteria bacterium]